jgi:protein phosphatase
VPSFFRKIVHKNKSEEELRSPSSATEAEMLPGDLESPGSAKIKSGDQNSAEFLGLENPQILVGAAQSKGIQRTNNEDALYTLTGNVLSNGRAIKFGLYAIADGMGGHENGELASSLAIGIFSEHIVKSIYIPLLAETGNQIDRSIQEIMREGVIMAHQAIKRAALGGGTTLTALLVIGDQATLAHIGDSRAYSFIKGKLDLLTHDHSLVKRMEEIGQLSPDEASVHPKRNLLYRAVGQGDNIEPDITSFSLAEGPILMLCSDGLWGVVDENVLKGALRKSAEPHIICQSLVDAANAAGGPDNISVIMVRLYG